MVNLKKKKLKNENSLRDLWDSIKHNNSSITEVPEERKKGTEDVFDEIMAENFPNLGKETDVQIQEAQRVRKKLNPKRPTLKHVIISQKLETKAFDNCQKLES